MKNIEITNIRTEAEVGKTAYLYVTVNNLGIYTSGSLRVHFGKVRRSAMFGLNHGESRTFKFDLGMTPTAGIMRDETIYETPVAKEGRIILTYNGNEIEQSFTVIGTIPPEAPPEEPPETPPFYEPPPPPFYEPEVKREYEPYIPPEEPPEEEPKACIIATCILGQNHFLLPTLRKFRDKYIPKTIMNKYYIWGFKLMKRMGKI